MKSRLPFLLAVWIAQAAWAGATWHVDAKTGDDAASGQSAAEPFKTIQKAADSVSPGDTVIVHPGIYFENVQLKTAGTKEKPIVFEADRVEKDRVILSGADPAIRAGKVAWQIDDASLNLYSVPLDHTPSRVLYSGTDLMAYPTLDSLKQFRLAGGYPAPEHGYAVENGRLFVRLHAGDLYGPVDPNKQTMCVAPTKGSGNAGVIISKRSEYNFGVLSAEPAYVTLDGFSFETPGAAGVYVAGSDVTVRNCWFTGCRTGVAGKENSPDATKTTNRVTIEYCSMTQFPAFADMKETIRLHADDPWRGDKEKFPQKVYWWARKGGYIAKGYTYEVGIGSNIGSDWVIRNCSMIDGFEFLSAWAVRWSRNLDVYQNHLERIVDNACEAEDHSVNLRFHDNDVIDTFEPFSWQPLGGPPWPGPVYFYRNRVWMMPQSVGLWATAGWTPGIFKLGVQESNWKRTDIKLAPDDPAAPAGEGFLAFNNTIDCPDHDVLTRVQTLKRPMSNFHIFNNVVVAKDFSPIPLYDAADLDFSHNIAAISGPTNATAAQNFTRDGAAVADAAKIGNFDPEKGIFDLTAASPAKGLKRPSSPAESLDDAGATPFGSAVKPLVTGPQPREEAK